MKRKLPKKNGVYYCTMCSYRFIRVKRNQWYGPFYRDKAMSFYKLTRMDDVDFVYEFSGCIPNLIHRGN